MAFFEPSSTFKDGPGDKKPLDDKAKKKYNDLRYTANSYAGKKAEKAFAKADKMKEKYDFTGVSYEGAGYIKM
jgi:hypothetical protein